MQDPRCPYRSPYRSLYCSLSGCPTPFSPPPLPGGGVLLSIRSKHSRFARHCPEAMCCFCTSTTLSPHESAVDVDVMAQRVKAFSTPAVSVILDPPRPGRWLEPFLFPPAQGAPPSARLARRASRARLGGAAPPPPLPFPLPLALLYARCSETSCTLRPASFGVGLRSVVCLLCPTPFERTSNPRKTELNHRPRPSPRPPLHLRHHHQHPAPPSSPRFQPVVHVQMRA